MFEIKMFCVDFVMCGKVHDVRAIRANCYSGSASGTLFEIMSDACATANCSFP